MSSANSVRVEMTFDGDFRELTAGGMEDEFERSLNITLLLAIYYPLSFSTQLYKSLFHDFHCREVRRTLLRKYKSSMDLQDDQIVITEVCMIFRCVYIFYLVIYLVCVCVCVCVCVSVA